MSGLALLFPGQASQAVGMGAALRSRSEQARAIYDLADRVTGLPITRLCQEGPLERLTETDVAQPAVVATSLAALAVLRDVAGDALAPTGVAGHSVGELAAYAAAEVLSEEATLSLVHARAQAMAAACRASNGTMAAVIGLDEEPLRRVCEQASQGDSVVALANLNAPGQLVISGDRAAIERAAAMAEEAGARRVLPLNVGGPFHSTYMQPAEDALRAALGRAALQPARVPVVANRDARPLQQVPELRAELAGQVTAPVRWSDTLQTLAEMGCDRFLEVGPGQVLVGLARRTLPGVRVASFGAPADLEAALPLVRDR